MTQYLIRTLTDSNGHPFTHVTKARDNETLSVVDAESKEDAERIAKDSKKYWKPIIQTRKDSDQ